MCIISTHVYALMNGNKFVCVCMICFLILNLSSEDLSCLTTSCQWMPPPLFYYLQQQGQIVRRHNMLTVCSPSRHLYS